MKKILFGFILGAVAFAGIGYAITVNPASAVTADSAATPLTIPYRDSTGSFAMIAGDIDTDKIGTDAVTTAKILNASVNTAKISTATNDSGKILASCGGQAMWRTGGTCP